MNLNRSTHHRIRKASPVSSLCECSEAEATTSPRTQQSVSTADRPLCCHFWMVAGLQRGSKKLIMAVEHLLRSWGCLDWVSASWLSAGRLYLLMSTDFCDHRLRSVVLALIGSLVLEITLHCCYRWPVISWLELKSWRAHSCLLLANVAHSHRSRIGSLGRARTSGRPSESHSASWPHGSSGSPSTWHFAQPVHLAPLASQLVATKHHCHLSHR